MTHQTVGIQIKNFHSIQALSTYSSELDEIQHVHIFLQNAVIKGMFLSTIYSRRVVAQMTAKEGEFKIKSQFDFTARTKDSIFTPHPTDNRGYLNKFTILAQQIHDGAVLR